jgi:outer membrane protein
MNKIIKKGVVSILVVSGISPIQAQDTIHLSLKEACKQGIENNAEVINAGLDKQKTVYQLQEAKSKLYPVIDAFSSFYYYYAIPKMVLPGEIFGQTGMISVQIGTKYDWSNGFRATQMLYNQSYLTSLKLTQQMGTIAGLNLQQKKEEVVYQISQLYYLCQTTRMQIKQLEITMQNTDRILEIAKLQSENGLIRRVDYSRISVNKNNIQTQIDNLEHLYQQQLGLMKYVMGFNKESIELSDSLKFTPAKDSVAIAVFSHRTELELLDKQLEVVSMERKLDQQSYLPTLSGFGQYYFEGQRDAFDFFHGSDKFYNVGLVGLSLSVPIFDGFEKHSKIRQKEIDLEQLQNKRKSTSDGFYRELSDASNQFSTSMKILTRQKENIREAEETYEVSLNGYHQQIVPLSDLMMSESSLAEARLSYYNALFQFEVAELDLRKAKGELLNY